MINILTSKFSTLNRMNQSLIIDENPKPSETIKVLKLLKY